MRIRYTPTTAIGAIVFDSAKITKFAVDNLYEGSDFNRSGRKHVIEGTATLTGTTSTNITTITMNLNKPRGKLEIDYGDGTFVTLMDNCDGVGDGPFDARNGPIPSVQIAEIVGATTSTILLNFSFTYFACGDERIQRFDMSVQQSIDHAGFIRLTKTGTLCVSAAHFSVEDNLPVPSDVTRVELGDDTAIPNPVALRDVANLHAPSPDLYRNMVAGSPPPMYVRKSQDYTIDSSLRTLSFTVVDEQVHRIFPDAVIAGTASFSYERALGETSMLGNKIFNCSFEGTADTLPQDLLHAACEASRARIDWVTDLIKSIKVSEPNLYGKNIVQLEIIALGTGTEFVDPKVVDMIFSDLHPNKTDYLYMWAYPHNGLYVNSVTGFIYDPCVPSIIASIISEQNPTIDPPKITLTVIPNDTTGGEIPTDDAPQVDDGMPSVLGPIKHYEAETSYRTINTGCGFMETVGGEHQFPFQFKLPKVLATQTVKMVSLSNEIAIPWERIYEPFVVVDQNIVVKSAALDAAGKPMYAIVATRTLQIQTANSENTYRVAAGAEGGMSRRVYSPMVAVTPRNPYNKGLSVAVTTDAQSPGTPARVDYIG